VEGDRDTGPAGAGGNLQLVGHVPHDPQAVTGQTGQPAHPGRILRTGRIAVINLTVQGPGPIPYPQSSRPPAMPDRVGGQFVNGQDHLGGLITGHARTAGMSVHLQSQLGQHAGVEHQVERRGDAASGGPVGPRPGGFTRAIFTAHAHRRGLSASSGPHADGIDDSRIA